MNKKDLKKLAYRILSQIEDFNESDSLSLGLRKEYSVSCLFEDEHDVDCTYVEDICVVKRGYRR